MKRERLLLPLALIVLALGAWWLSLRTEWVPERQYRPAQGEAAENPVYAMSELLRRLGMRVERHEALDRMPPPAARLLLLSDDWRLLQGTDAALRRWVGDGGQLVLAQGWEEMPLRAWLPVAPVERREFRPTRDQRKAADRLLIEPPLWGELKQLKNCGFGDGGQVLRAKAGSTPSWRLSLPGGDVALRVPLGQGSVTVLNAHEGIFQNRQALDCDNPLLFAAALQAERGATLWVYVSEKREPLLPWLWHGGWIAIVAAALALAAGLWRAALRFGPRLATPLRARRSVEEQVSGLAGYLHRHGRDALLAAQQRALDEAAARRLRGWRRLNGPAARARAIAAATGLPADDIAEAMRPRDPGRAALPARLQLLEAARRLLLSSSSSSSTRHRP